VTASLSGGSKQGIFLTQVTLTPTITAADGTATALGAITDEATTTPGYLIRKPYTYGSVFTIPAFDAAATSVSLTITYEMLLQTTPTSTQYAKQTATDDLSIVLA